MAPYVNPPTGEIRRNEKLKFSGFEPEETDIIRHKKLKMKKNTFITNKSRMWTKLIINFAGSSNNSKKHYQLSVILTDKWYCDLFFQEPAL